MGEGRGAVRHGCLHTRKDLPLPANPQDAFFSGVIRRQPVQKILPRKCDKSIKIIVITAAEWVQGFALYRVFILDVYFVNAKCFAESNVCVVVFDNLCCIIFRYQGGGDELNVRYEVGFEVNIDRHFG